MQDYYQILGISPRATNLEVKRSFRKLALQFHPDRNGTPESEERFKEINIAYEVLKDPQKRALYDLSLRPSVYRDQFEKTNHRDPAYRRSRAYAMKREEVKSSRELMEEYLPKFRWACWAGLVLCFFVILDYALPFTSYRQEVKEIFRLYRTGRGGGTIYDHDELITKNGTRIYLRDNDVLYFKESPFVNIQETRIFNKIITVATANEEYKVRVAAIYSGLFFVPVILLISSLLGISIRNSIEFPFNLSIVSFILGIIVVYLLIR